MRLLCGRLAVADAGVGSGGDSDVGPVSCGVCGAGRLRCRRRPTGATRSLRIPGRCFIPKAVFIGRCVSLTTGTTRAPRSARIVITFSLN